MISNKSSCDFCITWLENDERVYMHGRYNDEELLSVIGWAATCDLEVESFDNSGQYFTINLDCCGESYNDYLKGERRTDAETEV